jgi:ectoine hydroxylase-related dioxygenase (phytanoyl-CoA dioxygenase family)
MEDIFSVGEVAALTLQITALTHPATDADASRPTFRKTAELFAIRQFLKELPQIHPAIFTPNLKSLITKHAGPDYFIVKSIYFDKPEASNWFVAWHQDLTISVDKKIELPSFSNWTTKQHQFAVQPPIRYLESIVTVRIHLDDTDEHNGALRVIPGSHQKGIHRSTSAANTTNETTCPVKMGGVMLMRPLLQHASNRTTNGRRRRVIHIELSNLDLPDGLNWAEKMLIC